MTCTLTNAILVPNINRWKVIDVPLFDEAKIARVKIRVLSIGTPPRTKDFEIIINNDTPPANGMQAGRTLTLKKNPAPIKFDDDVIYGPGIVVETGYDQIEAAYRGAPTKAAALRAVEQKLIDLGIVDASISGTVG